MSGPTIPLLSIGPAVDVDPHTIHARTSVLMLLLTVGAWRDDILIDSRTRTVRIRRTRFYGFTSTRTIGFDEIAEVAYSMLGDRHGSVLTGEREGGEVFDIALTLHSGEEVPLLRFSGDGEYVADVSLPFEAIQDRIHESTDVRGNQQELSLGFVELLTHRLGVPLGSSRYF